jgi:hypothetical protein
MNNNNNTIIHNNYERPQDLTLLFKIPMGMQKGSFEIYRQFGHAPTKGSPALVYKVTSPITTIIMWSIPTRSMFEGNHWTYYWLITQPKSPTWCWQSASCYFHSLYVIRPHDVIGCGERRDLLRTITTGELFADVLTDYSWLSGSFKSIFIITIRL